MPIVLLLYSVRYDKRFIKTAVLNGLVSGLIVGIIALYNYNLSGTVTYIDTYYSDSVRGIFLDQLQRAIPFPAYTIGLQNVRDTHVGKQISEQLWNIGLWAVSAILLLGL